jgi:hypothetical protein
MLFETKSGQMLNRAISESLAPSLNVYTNIVDIWSVILNEDQQVDGGSITRLFLQTSTFVSFIF